MKNKKTTKASGAKKLSGTTARDTISKDKKNSGSVREQSHHYAVTSKIRAIGNSKGVILSNRVMEEAGISSDADLIIRAADGMIIIEAKPSENLNTNLSSWDAQFKQAIKKGNKTETDLWEGLPNQFDKEDWT